jgi:poly-gamma-glutamate synthesis protein (capsule biosynthesis protein)
MTIVNLEGVLTDSENRQPDRTYNIKGAPEYVQILTEGSVEAVSFSNNHRQDYGEEGTSDTIDLLEDAEIMFAYDSTVGYYVKEDITIGFVSVNESTQGKGVEKYLEQGIAALKETDADIILACCHWGTERDYYPEVYQQELGKKCIDWGADLVIGHHPHVLQGVEEYKGKFIVHSLGNFCFGANRNPTDKDTMIFQQTFRFVDGVRQEDREIKVIPCRISSVSNRNDYCPTPAEGEEAIRIIGRINEFSKDMGVQFTDQGYLVQ